MSYFNGIYTRDRQIKGREVTTRQRRPVKMIQQLLKMYNETSFYNT